MTACNHVFCMEHKDLPKIKESTCPGCNKHLSPKNGLKIAHYGVDPTALNGLRPEQAVKAALTSVKFWCACARERGVDRRYRASPSLAPRTSQGRAGADEDAVRTAPREEDEDEARGHDAEVPGGPR